MIHKIFYAFGDQKEGKTGNKKGKKTRILQTNAVQRQVQECLQQQKQQRQRTTARQIFDYLMQQNLLCVTTDANGKYEKKPSNQP